MLFGSYFVGALAYADDLVLLAPTPIQLCVSCLVFVTNMEMNLVCNKI